VPLKKGIIKLLYLEIERMDQIYVIMKCFHFHFDVAYGKPLYVEFPRLFFKYISALHGACKDCVQSMFL